MSDDEAAAASPPFVAPAAGPFRVGDWTVDPARDEISRDGETVKLEPRKMQLLVALARRLGEVVTPDQLLDAVWRDLVVTHSSVYQTVAQLRKTLGDNRAMPEYIATVPRKGYRLIAPIAPAAESRALVARAVVAAPVVAPDTTAPVLPVRVPVPVSVEPGRVRSDGRHVLTRAVDLGWRRAWMIRHDPSLRTIRDDARIAPLIARVRSDMDRQRAHLG